MPLGVLSDSNEAGKNSADRQQDQPRYQTGGPHDQSGGPGEVHLETFKDRMEFGQKYKRHHPHQGKREQEYSERIETSLDELATVADRLLLILADTQQDNMKLTGLFSQPHETHFLVREVSLFGG